MQARKYYEICKEKGNYVILTKWIKLQHEKNPSSYLKSMQNVGFEQTLLNLLRFLLNNSLWEKTVMETISVAITGSSNMHCLGLYLINIFMKSRKAERCTDVMFKLAFYCLYVTAEDLNL